jgi:quercetin 2,3-dioxygenase
MSSSLSRRNALLALGAGPVGLACKTLGTPTGEIAVSRHRSIESTLRGMATSDGAGVKLTRVIGQPALRNLDPFLMLDRFHSDDPNAYIAGFPDHPHRGFETVTVMLNGKMHSEMPEQERGLMSGFQLWVNLPSHEKLCDPFYQDLQPAALSHAKFGRASEAHVIAGDWFGVKGPVRARPSEPMLAHVVLGPGEALDTPVPSSHRTFLFLGQGSVTIGKGTDDTQGQLSKDQIAVLGQGDRISIQAGSEGAAFLLAAGKPFGEPIVQYGPFVMNTQSEIEKAFHDYRKGTLGHD